MSHIKVEITAFLEVYTKCDTYSGCWRIIQAVVCVSWGVPHGTEAFQLE